MSALMTLMSALMTLMRVINALMMFYDVLLPVFQAICLIAVNLQMFYSMIRKIKHFK